MVRSRSARRIGGLSEDGRETSMSDSVHGSTISDTTRSAAEPGMLGGILAGCGLFILMQSVAAELGGSQGRVLDAASMTSHYRAMGRGVGWRRLSRGIW